MNEQRPALDQNDVVRRFGELEMEILILRKEKEGLIRELADAKKPIERVSLPDIVIDSSEE